jgi:hypothetical protein
MISKWSQNDFKMISKWSQNDLFLYWSSETHLFYFKCLCKLPIIKYVLSHLGRVQLYMILMLILRCFVYLYVSWKKEKICFSFKFFIAYITFIINHRLNYTILIYKIYMLKMHIRKFNIWLKMRILRERERQLFRKTIWTFYFYISFEFYMFLCTILIVNV